MRMPPARATIAICCITGFAYVGAVLTGQGDHLAQAAGFIPARLTADLAIDKAAPVWLTPLTATLVHANVWHIVFNLLMIAFCGKLVEASIGPGGLVALYLVGAYASAGAEWAVAPHGQMAMIGASGAGSAIIGAYAVLYSRRKLQGWGPIPGQWLQVLWLAVGWVVIQLLLGYASWGVPGVPDDGMIATPAHIGGFLAGLALARPLLLFRYRRA